MIHCGPFQPYSVCDSVFLSGQLCQGSKASCSVSEVSVKSLSVIEMSFSEVMLKKKKEKYFQCYKSRFFKDTQINSCSSDVSVNDTLEGNLALSKAVIKYSDVVNLVFNIDLIGAPVM